MIEPAVLIDALLPGEQILDLDLAVRLHVHRAFDVERGGARLALVRRQRAQNRGVGEERREQLIAHDPEFELLLEPAIGLERDLHGDRRRPVTGQAGNRRRAILLNRADDIAQRGDLHRRGHARQQRVDVRLRHRKRDRPEVEERMAERVNLVADHFRDRARRAHVEVAADDVDADRGTGTKRRCSLSSRASVPAAAAPATGMKP